MQQRGSTAPHYCSGSWPVQPAVSFVDLLASGTAPYTNSSQSLTSCRYLQVLGKVDGKGQTAQRNQNRCRPAVSPSEQVERSDGHVKPPCLQVSALCLQRTELWEAGGWGEMVAYSFWDFPVLLWSSDWGGLLARA